MAESIYTDEDLASVNQTLVTLRDALDLAERGLRAGMDLNAQKSRLLEQQAQLLRWKQEFFPGR